MKPLNLAQSIRLTFAHTAAPGEPLALDKVATDKLGHIPGLLRALAECHGSRLGDPTLWGGDIYLEISSDAELFDVVEVISNALTITAKELKANAQLKPPLPLAQAATNVYCIDLLHALAKTYDKCQLTASLHIVGKKPIELPHPDLTIFTKPEKKDEDQRYLRAKVIGVCIPTPDANVVLLGDLTLLELPTNDYVYGIDEIFERVVKCSAMFIGTATFVSKNRYRALPGGILEAQPSL
jgi:hypothetical protein